MTLTCSLLHTAWLGGSLTNGIGFTVMSNVTGWPLQPLMGVTVMVPVVTAPTFAVVKLMLPVPEAPNPMAVLLLVHEKVAPALPVNGTFTTVLAQAVTSAGSFTVGPTLPVTVTLSNQYVS